MKLYETNKMLVEIGADTVKKVFKVHRKHASRYAKEKEALQRLAGSKGFPQLISTDDVSKTIVMSKLQGENKEHLSDLALDNLRSLVHNMLQAGVARHAIPERDLLVTEQQDTNMVDFERITLRRFHWSPFWIVAKKATRFNLLRFISQHNSDILTEQERSELASLTKARARLQFLANARAGVRARFRKICGQPSDASTYKKKFRSSKSHKVVNQTTAGSSS